MRIGIVPRAALSWLFVPLSVYAEPGPAADDDAPATETPSVLKPSAEPTAPSSGVRRDPDGKKGISPYWEAVSEGDAAFVAKDLEAAAGAYRQAVKAEPKNALAHYRLGAALRASGEANDAMEVFATGLGFAKGSNEKGKLLFARAVAEELSGNLDRAINEWKKYAALATGKNGDTATQLYLATAEERLKRLAEAKERQAQYAEVKARIEKREAELEQKTKGDSK